MLTRHCDGKHGFTLVAYSSALGVFYIHPGGFRIPVLEEPLRTLSAAMAPST